MQQFDRASKFTLEYLNILENSLHFTYDENGNPVVEVSQVNTFSLTILKQRLNDLLSSTLADDAIVDSRDYGNTHIQTLGFGLVPPEDFDRFVKMGFFCGTRLILWDLIGTRLLREISDNPNQIIAITDVTQNLLSLQKIVKEGGLVILPHPIDWSEEANDQVDQLDDSTRDNPMNYGLIVALSIIEEIPLHPYTIYSSSSVNWPKKPFQVNENYYSPDHYIFHQVINDIFEDARFAYLGNVNASKFYEIVSKDSTFYSEFRRFLNPISGHVSPQEIAIDTKTQLNKLSVLVERHNKNFMTEFSSDFIGRFVQYVGAAFILIGQNNPSPLTAIGSSMMVINPTIWNLLNRIATKKDRNVLIQTFSEIREAAKSVST